MEINVGCQMMERIKLGSSRLRTTKIEKDKKSRRDGENFIKTEICLAQPLQFVEE